MSGRFAAYIGAPPPHLRKRKRRSLSPVVPDPEELTYASAAEPVLSPEGRSAEDRRDAFGPTPTRSARVFKTYAHKRARSYASSGGEDEMNDDGGEQGSSHSSSPEVSPSKVKYGAPPRTSTAVVEQSIVHDAPPPLQPADDALVVALNSLHSGPDNLNASPEPAVFARSLHNPRRKQSVYVEISSRPKALSRTSTGQSAAAPSSLLGNAPQQEVRVPRPRGRPRKIKPVTAMPSPPPTSDDSHAPIRTRPRAPSVTHNTLSDALNDSLANTAGPSTLNFLPVESSSAPPKRKRGRPPGKGRSLAELGPVIFSYGDLDSLSSPTRRMAVSQFTSKNAAVNQSASNTAVVSAPPVKRGPGRPRKHPLPATSISAPRGPSSSRPSISSGPSKKGKARDEVRHEDGDEDMAEADAVAEQLLQDLPRDPAPTVSPRKDQYVFQSVDVSNVARALENQAAREAANASATGHIPAPPVTPGKRPRGRPPGSKNKATLLREAEARARRFTTLTSAAPVRTVGLPAGSSSNSQNVPEIAPVPIKRRPGRPRKSAPAGLAVSLEYFEPLKDPDASVSPARPSTPGPRRRGRSLTRRNSIAGPPSTPAVMSAPGFTRTRRSASAAAPPDPPPFYLDLNTMEWKRRAPRSSVSPVRRRRRRSSAAAFLAAGQEGEVTEYQSCGELCTALKEVLLGTEPKIAHESVSDATRGTRKGKGNGKAKEADDGLKVAQSGVLLVADDDDDEDEDAASENAAPGTCIFRGSWAVFGDPSVTLDDGLVLKKLHEVVRGIDAYVTRLEQADFIRTMDDPTRTTTVSVTVPCCCITLRSLLSQQTSSSDGEQPQCAGEMVVSVAESQAERSFGTVAMALRMTVVVVH